MRICAHGPFWLLPVQIHRELKSACLEIARSGVQRVAVHGLAGHVTSCSGSAFRFERGARLKAVLPRPESIAWRMRRPLRTDSWWVEGALSCLHHRLGFRFGVERAISDNLDKKRLKWVNLRFGIAKSIGDVSPKPQVAVFCLEPQEGLQLETEPT